MYWAVVIVIVLPDAGAVDAVEGYKVAFVHCPQSFAGKIATINTKERK
jgi:hypothetical protein